MLYIGYFNARKSTLLAAFLSNVAVLCFLIVCVLLLIHNTFNKTNRDPVRLIDVLSSIRRIRIGPIRYIESIIDHKYKSEWKEVRTKMMSELKEERIEKSCKKKLISCN